MIHKLSIQYLEITYHVGISHQTMRKLKLKAFEGSEPHFQQRMACNAKLLALEGACQGHLSRESHPAFYIGPSKLPLPVAKLSCMR